MKVRRGVLVGLPLDEPVFDGGACVCLGLLCRAREQWNLSESSSHIEVIERLTRKAVTWTPSREAHVAGL